MRREVGTFLIKMVNKLSNFMGNVGHTMPSANMKITEKKFLRSSHERQFFNLNLNFAFGVSKLRDKVI